MTDMARVTKLSARMLDRTAKTYSTALATFWWIGMSGLGTCLIGTFTSVDALVQIGTCAFLSLFSGWGFVNGGVFVWGLVQAVRCHGWVVLVENLWASFSYLALMAFFIAFGSGTMWMIIRAATHAPATTP